MRLSSKQIKGKTKIMDWGFNNFHKLKEVNKVKMWLKMAESEFPHKIIGEGFASHTHLTLIIPKEVDDSSKRKQILSQEIPSGVPVIPS